MDWFKTFLVVAAIVYIGFGWTIGVMVWEHWLDPFAWIAGLIALPIWCLGIGAIVYGWRLP